MNGLPWKQTEIILLFLRLDPSTAFQTLSFIELDKAVAHVIRLASFL